MPMLSRRFMPPEKPLTLPSASSCRPVSVEHNGRFRLFDLPPRERPRSSGEVSSNFAEPSYLRRAPALAARRPTCAALPRVRLAHGKPLPRTRRRRRAAPEPLIVFSASSSCPHRWAPTDRTSHPAVPKTKHRQPPSFCRIVCAVRPQRMTGSPLSAVPGRAGFLTVAVVADILLRRRRF